MNRRHAERNQCSNGNLKLHTYHTRCCGTFLFFDVVEFGSLEVQEDPSGQKQTALGASLSGQLVVLRLVSPGLWCFPGIQRPR